jgi:hypothetical protein
MPRCRGGAVSANDREVACSSQMRIRIIDRYLALFAVLEMVWLNRQTMSAPTTSETSDDRNRGESLRRHTQHGRTTYRGPAS